MVRRDVESGAKRDGGGEALFVLKTPLWLDDVRGLADPEAALVASRDGVLDVARALEQTGGAVFSRLEGRVTLPDGSTGYLVPHYPVTLERRIQEGIGITGLLDVLIATVKALRPLASSTIVFHGNLRASNIALDERGGVILLDPASPAVRNAWSRLPVQGHPGIAPEVAAGAGFSPAVDGYALTAILLRAVLGDDPLPPYAREGLAKGPAAHLKNRVIDRLKQEDSNPRFHQRLADRLGALVSRGLSREASPSPPYRFARLDELLTRLEEVQALVRPVANTVGKVLLDRLPSQSWFLTDEPLSFSCTVGCTTGVEAHEEIGVGLAVFDQDRNLRLKDLDLGYTAEKHPSGRFKFSFRVNGLMPGRYLLRLAFAVRDSGQPPVTTETETIVRPAPGWVPPPEPPPATPLRFDPRVEAAEAASDATVPAISLGRPRADAPGEVRLRVAPEPSAKLSADPAIERETLAPAPDPRVAARLVATAEPLRAPEPAAVGTANRRDVRPEPPRAEPPRVEARLEARVEPHVDLRTPDVRAARSVEPRELVPEPRQLEPRLSAPRPEPSRAPESARSVTPEQRFNVPEPRISVEAARPAEPRAGEPRPIPPRAEPEPVRAPELRSAEIRAAEPRNPEVRAVRLDISPVPEPPSDARTLAPVEAVPVAEPKPAVQPATPASVRFEETPAPVPRRRDWTAEPLPSGSTPAGFEEEGTNADLEEDNEPGLVSRILHQIKNDSYLLVATTLIGVIVLLLVALFFVQS